MILISSHKLQAWKNLAFPQHEPIILSSFCNRLAKMMLKLKFRNECSFGWNFNWNLEAFGSGLFQPEIWQEMKEKRGKRRTGGQNQRHENKMGWKIKETRSEVRNLRRALKTLSAAVRAVQKGFLLHCPLLQVEVLVWNWKNWDDLENSTCFSSS